MARDEGERAGGPEADGTGRDGRARRDPLGHPHSLSALPDASAPRIAQGASEGPVGVSAHAASPQGVPPWLALLRERVGENAARHAVMKSCARGPRVKRGKTFDEGEYDKLVASEKISEARLVTLARRAGIDEAQFVRDVLTREGYLEAGDVEAVRAKREGGARRGHGSGVSVERNVWNNDRRTRVASRGAILSATGVVLAAATSHPEVVQRSLGTPERVTRYCEIVWEGVERGEPECMKLFPKLLGLIGGGRDVEEFVQRLLGAKNMVEVVRKLQIADMAEGIVDEEGEALRFVNERRVARGEMAYPEVWPAPEAEVASGGGAV